MEGDTRRGGDESAAVVYMLTLGVMEDLLEKLKLLDYETQFCRTLSFRPLTR